MKAVILAAGRGERLSPYTDRMPKPLLPIGGRTIIEHVISSLNQAGIDDFVVVTGYLGSKVRRRLGDGGGLGVDIRYVQNPDYMRGNASSLLCAAEALENEGPFLLAMSDHLIERDIPKRALESFRGEPLLCVDKMPIYMNDVGEATKVLVDDEGYIRNIGKGIPEWNMVDAGVFILDTGLFDLISNRAAHRGISDCMRVLIEESSLRACDVTGLLWLDVDTWDDVTRAREMIREWA